MSVSQATMHNTSSPSATSTSPLGVALVVEDNRSQRLLLRSRLEQLNYTVVEAADGEEGLARFIEKRPDVVIMDVVMPRMNGFEATRRIKAHDPHDFVPVVFLTSLDPDQLRRCIEAGGDDVLGKPYDPAMLGYKLRALIRSRSLHREFRELHQHMQREQEIAEEVLSSAVLRGNAKPPGLEQLQRPASTFCGDLLLVGYADNGDLHLLLGDFTGHGLSAALGAMPASQVFRAMLAKGFPPQQILAGINAKLRQLMPTGLFMAGIYVVLPTSLDRFEVCNCGMPDGLLLGPGDSSVERRIESAGLPLGVLDRAAGEYVFASLPVSRGARLVLTSDGVTEACNPSGEAFGVARLERLVMGAPRGGAVALVQNALQRFCADAPQADDISMVALSCDELLLSGYSPSSERNGVAGIAGRRTGSWEASVTQRGAQLGNVAAVTALVQQVRELEMIDPTQGRAMHQLLTKMYDAALDGGVLDLDLPASAEARQQALLACRDEWLRIKLLLEHSNGEVHMRLHISHSGAPLGESVTELLGMSGACCCDVQLGRDKDGLLINCSWSLDTVR